MQLDSAGSQAYSQSRSCSRLTRYPPFHHPNDHINNGRFIPPGDQADISKQPSLRDPLLTAEDPTFARTLFELPEATIKAEDGVSVDSQISEGHPESTGPINPLLKSLASPQQASPLDQGEPDSDQYISLASLQLIIDTPDSSTPDGDIRTYPNVQGTGSTYAIGSITTPLGSQAEDRQLRRVPSDDCNSGSFVEEGPDDIQEATLEKTWKPIFQARAEELFSSLHYQSTGPHQSGIPQINRLSHVSDSFQKMVERGRRPVEYVPGGRCYFEKAERGITEWSKHYRKGLLITMSNEFVRNRINRDGSIASSHRDGHLSAVSKRAIIQAVECYLNRESPLGDTLEQTSYQSHIHKILEIGTRVMMINACEVLPDLERVPRIYNKHRNVHDSHQETGSTSGPPDDDDSLPDSSHARYAPIIRLGSPLE